MRRAYLLAGLVVALAMIGVRAYAVWIEVQLTPKGLQGGDQTFKITSKQVDDLTEFVVTVEPRAGKRLSPFLRATLSVATADAHVASVPVAEAYSHGSVTYQFRVSPEYLSNSRFELREQGYEQVMDEQGKPEFRMTLGGQAYWFRLKDFN